MKKKYSTIFYDVVQPVAMGLPIAIILSIIIALLCGNALSLSTISDYKQDLKNIELVDKQYASTSKNIAYIYNSQLDKVITQNSQIDPNDFYNKTKSLLAISDSMLDDIGDKNNYIVANYKRLRKKDLKHKAQDFFTKLLETSIKASSKIAVDYNSLKANTNVDEFNNLVNVRKSTIDGYKNGEIVWTNILLLFSIIWFVEIFGSLVIAGIIAIILRLQLKVVAFDLLPMRWFKIK